MKTVDISEKAPSRRTAVAEGRLSLKEETVNAIREGKVRKGDPFKVAESAALLAVKKTPELIPHCHNLPIASISVELSIKDAEVLCTCAVKANYSTGVEMEALVGVSVALLTVWDMVKYLEKNQDGQYPGTAITGIRVLTKLKEGNA
ncbi:MAG: cyclic pyranopterin monophosphate synthase MoaC [Candidatus Thermoplasmatota archaeon]|nr:cyclic pyranopterin monophosphate synthase MoaC [Euryarchaeota archaeon]MBU4032446.1 cyclic pyranopterin monophosphate synthase MoaC [Candidatus Thermoplasmatota archaeon]MBU4071559.1 cyclic pyranopterin monophosphate synthase MoaC [Candidatus Thermoplasmatota archaeon]MBU4144474.1 cyclic pyranopterin monophosphate synthase MoaC [Candidatus Thermoplasmatota archaeon]MBU4592294.1 cyclic pyranopterin monophosphate synthase MoaC [Candidatus Thermoplasmatota archaeon]